MSCNCTTCLALFIAVVVGVGLLACNALCIYEHLLELRRNILSQILTVRRDLRSRIYWPLRETVSIFRAVCFFGTLISTYKSARHYNHEDQHIYSPPVTSEITIHMTVVNIHFQPVFALFI
jgi:hypothetical protein